MVRKDFVKHSIRKNKLFFVLLILTIIFENIDKRKLNTIVLNLNNEIEALNKEIKQYKTHSDILMNENIQLKNEILQFQRDEKDYKGIIEELKQKVISSDLTSPIKPNEYVKYSTPLQSIIIRTNKEYEFVLNIIPTKHKLKLLYRATRDGDNHDVFLSMVGKAMNTLSIVETEFGDKIGGELAIKMDIQGHILLGSVAAVRVQGGWGRFGPGGGAAGRVSFRRQDHHIIGKSDTCRQRENQRQRQQKGKQFFHRKPPT